MDYEARLHQAQNTHYSERTMEMERLVEEDADEREREEEERIERRVAELMKNPEPEYLDWIADCYSHLYPELVAIVCAALSSGSADSCRTKLQRARSMIEGQFSVAAGYKQFGGTRT